MSIQVRITKKYIPADELSNKKFSFAGVKAKTANIDTLDAAQRLEDIGKADADQPVDYKYIFIPFRINFSEEV